MKKSDKCCGAVSMLVKKIRSFWLFGDSCKEQPFYKKVLFVLFNTFVLAASCVLLGVLSLSVSYGEMYSKGIFYGYLQNGYILILNILPVIILGVIFYALTGRIWSAFLCDSVVTLGFTFSNFYL